MKRIFILALLLIMGDMLFADFGRSSGWNRGVGGISAGDTLGLSARIDSLRTAMVDSFSLDFELPPMNSLLRRSFYAMTAVGGRTLLDITGSGVVTESVFNMGVTPGSREKVYAQSIYVIIDGDTMTRGMWDEPVKIPIDRFCMFGENSPAGYSRYSAKSMHYFDANDDSCVATFIYRVPIPFESSLKIICYASSLGAVNMYFRADGYYCDAAYLPPWDWGCYYVEDTLGTNDACIPLDIEGKVGIVGQGFFIKGTSAYFGGDPSTLSIKFLEGPTYLYSGGVEPVRTSLAEFAYAGDETIKVNYDLSLLQSVSDNHEWTVLLRHGTEADTSYNTAFGQTIGSLRYSAADSTIWDTNDSTYVRGNYGVGSPVLLFAPLDSFTADEWVSYSGVEEGWSKTGWYIGDESQDLQGWPKRGLNSWWSGDQRTIEQRTGVHDGLATPMNIYQWNDPIQVSRTRFLEFFVQSWPTTKNITCGLGFISHVMLFDTAGWSNDTLLADTAIDDTPPFVWTVDSFYSIASDAGIEYYKYDGTLGQAVKNATGTCINQTATDIYPHVRQVNNDSFRVGRGRISIPITGVDETMIDSARIYFTTTSTNPTGGSDSLYFFLANYPGADCATGDYNDTLLILGFVSDTLCPIASKAWGSILASTRYGIDIPVWALDSLVRDDTCRVMIRCGGDYKYGQYYPSGPMYYDLIYLRTFESDIVAPYDSTVWIRIGHWVAN